MWDSIIICIETLRTAYGALQRDQLLQLNIHGNEDIKHVEKLIPALLCFSKLISPVLPHIERRLKGLVAGVETL